MRRGLASLIMGLSLLVATASWAGFVMSRTVLDPGRSERLADTLLDNEEIRATIIDRLADSAEAQIPADVPVARDVLEEGAANALDDPRVEALIRDGLVQVHQNALNGVDEPVMLDAAALGQAGRDAVVAQQPDLEQFLPPTPSLEVELPSAGLSWLGTVKRAVDRFTLIGAVVAIVGISTAFVLARNRAAALRRVAFWAIAASAFWIAAAYALPWVLEQVAPSSVAIAMAAIDVFFGAMIRPAVTLAGIGVGLLLLSFFWPALERRRPAAQLDRTSAPVRRADGGWGLVPSAASVAAQPPVRDAGRPPAASPVARQVPSRPGPYEERAGYLDEWTPGLGRPPRAPGPPEQPPLDATRQFPQVWSNVGREASRPVPPQPPPMQVKSPIPSQPPPAPPTEVNRPVPAQPPPTAGAVPEPAPATEIVQPVVGDIGRAGATQVARPGDLPAVPPVQPDREPVQPPPAFDIDADAAADADDFGAEWVEGRGYVERDSGR